MNMELTFYWGRGRDKTICRTVSVTERNKVGKLNEVTGLVWGAFLYYKSNHEPLLYEQLFPLKHTSHSYLGTRIPGKGNSRCQGPEVQVYLVWGDRVCRRRSGRRENQRTSGKPHYIEQNGCQT